MLNIAIDGPAGAGKSTIAKEIAKRLGIIYLDTGAMYRAMALKALENGLNPDSKEQVLPIINDTDVKVAYLDGVQHVFLDGRDVSSDIRKHDISKAASDISKIPEVRVKLVEIQRKIASENDVVLDGRDITSYVLPNANFKFFLTASKEERAKRRWLELKERGENADYDKILADIIERDYNDSHRAFAPLTKTDDSVLIDSTLMQKERVVETIVAHIEEER